MFIEISFLLYSDVNGLCAQLLLHHIIIMASIVGTNNEDDISAVSCGGFSFTVYWWLCTPSMSGPMLHRETEDTPQTAEQMTWEYLDDCLAWTNIIPHTWYKGPESKMLKRFSNLNASVTADKTLCEFYHSPHFHVKAIECGLYPLG